MPATLENDGRKYCSPSLPDLGMEFKFPGAATAETRDAVLGLCAILNGNQAQ